LVKRAQAMDGTCTGEHGIGQGKQEYLVGELGLEAIETMRLVKRALDPDNIFNPGKILPAS
jgi:D-lactate dehydrogenase (cytochrome)